MKSSILKLTFFVTATLFLSSCAHRMVGTWNIQRYETANATQQGVTLNNIGTMTFNKNNSGEKNINYTVLGAKREDKAPFKWNWQDGKYMTIESEGSEFAKTWIVVENKRKFQKWKSTDGGNNVQIIELAK